MAKFRLFLHMHISEPFLQKLEKKSARNQPLSGIMSVNEIFE